MSVDEDTHAMMSAFCEECGATDCRSRSLSYDDDGQEAIDFIANCAHYQAACTLLNGVTSYRRGE